MRQVESFHGRLREECLAVSWFQNLFDARRKITAWRKEYNEERPHSSLGYRHRSSLLLLRPQASTELKFVVFLRERKQGQVR